MANISDCAGGLITAVITPAARIDALGGEIRVGPGHGAGTTINGRVPGRGVLVASPCSRMALR